ncbi:MAG: ferrochelatase [Neisseria sp.]|uniref:ferrochelatase n=1 Tax=Neisseria sp. TaxID=192066 RepID=UPI0026DB864E|nr:ferrochelatase [Neisseria sp.]MDO4642177.1 ferrochelatase [Neisseria sp.]
MSRFRTEPAIAFSEQNKTAILLLNLGTPKEPTPQAVRPYLRDFLSDQRVVELPPALWQPLLHGMVLTLRPKKSAHGYEKVWFPEGSPLAVYTERQSAALAERLPGVLVRHAMTYGKPAVSDVIDELKAQGVSQLLVIPLYPQYAASSTGAALDKVLAVLFRQRNMMSLRTVSRFYHDEGYIYALSQQIQAYWAEHGRGQKLMFSFHGVPQASCDKGDPYLYECSETVRLLARQLNLNEQDYVMSFQSRFGRAKWLGPSTQDLLIELPKKQGVTKLDVICPGFIGDCLETMEEIAIAGRESFHEAGGEQFNYIPCLNTNPLWIEALAELADKHLQGWI